MTRIMDVLSTQPTDLPPRYGSDRALTAIARIASLIEGGRQLTVSLYGSQPIQVSAAAVNWEGVTTCHVLLDPDTGRPVHALSPAPTPENPLPPIPEPHPVEAQAASRVLTPEWVGTYTPQGAWTRQAGLARQGGGASALADYGAQASSLGDVRVRRMVLALRAASWVPAWQVVVRAGRFTPAGVEGRGVTVSARVNAPRLEVDVTALAPLVLQGYGLALVGTSRGAVRASGESLSVLIEYES